MKKPPPVRDEEFRAKVTHLRTLCPPPAGTKVEVSRKPRYELNEEGYCVKKGRTFSIVVNQNLNDYELEHVLIHEWAHMMAWRPYHPLVGDHGPDWGVWYAVVYRKYHGVE